MRRRDLLGTGAFALLAGASSAGTIGLRHLQRSAPEGVGPTLERLPSRFGPWRLCEAQEDMVDPVEIDGAFDAALQIYDQVLERDYVAATLPRIMLNLAYKRTVRQEERFHWPEFCYATQGFEVTRLPPAPLGIEGAGVAISRFVGVRSGRRELVGYFMRIGDELPVGSMALRLSLFRQNLTMAVPDGLLLRASFILDDLASDDLASASNLLCSFFRLLIETSEAPLRKILIG